MQADLEFVERSFADEEQYSEQDYKLGAAQVEEQAEPQGDAQQVEEGGSGTWLHAGATKHRAKVAMHKDQVATALRQRKADAVATPKVAVDPDIAHCQRLNSRNGLKGQTLRRPQRVPSFAPEWIPDLHGRRRTVRLSASNF